MKTTKLIFSLLTFVLMLGGTRLALAQYGYGYGHGGYGYGPQGTSQFGYKHRMHGYIGGQLNGLVVLQQKTDGVEYFGSGGGGGLYGGVRMGPFFSLEFNYAINYQANDYQYYDYLYIQTITVDGKLHIPTAVPIEPFIQFGGGFGLLGVSYGSYYSHYSYDWLLATGPTFRLGGGFDFWVSPIFSVGGRMLYQGLYFGDPRESIAVQKSNFISALSFDVFGTFHF